MSEKKLNMQELTSDELAEVNGGESVFYYIAYGFGYCAHAYTDNWASMTTALGTNMRR
jgi:bacteriocin-like protein